MTLRVDCLTKRYGKTFTLAVPELEITRSETFGLVGNNGAGKTTFLRLVLDLIRADEGEVLVDGENVARSFEWKKTTGSYLDEGFLIDFLTADEFFAFTGQVYGLSATEIERALDPFRGFYTDEPLGQTTKYLRALSQGNRKKTGLIAALFTRPKLLILDEPFTNLDPRSQIQFKDYLHRLRKDVGTTMLISSHDLGHIIDVCDRIALLENGNIVRDEPTTVDTLANLRDYFARELREARNADDFHSIGQH